MIKKICKYNNHPISQVSYHIISNSEQTDTILTEVKAAGAKKIYDLSTKLQDITNKGIQVGSFGEEEITKRTEYKKSLTKYIGKQIEKTLGKITGTYKPGRASGILPSKKLLNNPQVNADQVAITDGKEGLNNWNKNRSL